MPLALRVVALVALVVYTLGGFGVFALTNAAGWLGAGLGLWCLSELPWHRP